MRRRPEEAADVLGASEVGLRSRGQLLKLAVVGSGVVLLGGIPIERIFGAPARAPSASQDRRILKFALLLEYLQASFYAEALSRARLRGELREFAEVVGGHEQAHVDYIKKALGQYAQPKPAFSLGAATRNARAFATTARALEDAGVAAYNGQAANLTRPTLGAAARIVSVEGRHAAWIRDIIGIEPAPRPADPGTTAGQVVASLKSHGFLRRTQ
jgi:rubrerythrin